jgi:hypothetical protein
VRICLHLALHPYPGNNQRPGWTTFLRHPIACLLPDGAGRHPHPPKEADAGALAHPGSARARHDGYGNINPLSIDYACRPRLRSRLTLGGKACPRNPWSSGGGVSHPSFATHACILTRVASTTRLHGRFPRHTTLPYPSRRPTPPSPMRPGSMSKRHGFGGVLEPRYIVGAEPLDQ